MTKLPLSVALIGGALLLPTSALFLSCAAPARAASEADPGQIAVSVAKALEQLHYTRHSLDNTMSTRLLHTYLESLDYGRLFFTQKDVAEFERKYNTELDDDIFLGDVSPAYAIYDVYLKRVEARVVKIKELVKSEKFDFDGKGSIEISRQKSPWPKDEEEADSLWHDRIENELLTESLSEHPVGGKADAVAATNDKTAGDKPEVVVSKRYDRLLRSIHEQTKDDEAKFFLNALALSYDPHSEYMSASEMDNFSINMRLSLVGIGAMLRSEDGYAKIIELIPGGPAATEGELKIDDRITAVAQGSDAFVDAQDMKLDKVVEMIRGKKNTQVRLQVLPAGTTDTSKRKVIAINRDEVKLTEGEAKAEIIEHVNAQGQMDKLGWITLPGFYADMDRTTHVSGKPKSTTRDVAALLGRLNKEGIAGLVMDLRRNGGGSLEEAINLTGLFIKKGPVVQSKDYQKHIEVQSDKDPNIAYSGPMVVLTSHISASASEIFAGALQDYGRAMIVGDKNTFGKGTVQTLLEVGRFMSPFGLKMTEAGALKLTIQKFYRPSGQSTQLKGVESDIVLPSRYAHLDSVGEDALKFPLPYDEVKPSEYEKWPAPGYDVADLRTRSSGRVKNDPEFRYLMQDIDKMDERVASNKLSLNKAEREKELAADKKRIEDIKAERASRHVVLPVAYQLTLADVDKPRLARVVEKKDKEKTDAKSKDGDKAQPKATPAPSTEDDGADALADDDTGGTGKSSEALDPIKTESLNILADMIDQQKHPKLAKTRD